MPDEAQHDLEAAYEGLVDAVLALDDSAIERAADWVLGCLAALGEAGVEAAVDIAVDLLDGWENAAEVAEEAGPEAAEQLRSVIADLVLRLADGFPDPLLDGLGIELLNEAGSPAAAPRALAVLAERGLTMDDDLGRAVLRALIVEAGRQEDRGQPITGEIAEGLRAGLGREDWLPEPLTPSDLAVAVAWADFTRDDLRRLETTIAGAVGPFSDADVAAQAALLRAMVPFTHADVIGMERALRRAAPAVKESGDPRIVTAYRLMVQMLQSSRGGAGLADLVGESEGREADQGKTLDDSVRLFSDCLSVMNDLDRAELKAVPEALRARLDAWCAAGVHPGTEPMIEAVLWWLGHAFALLEHDADAAAQRLRRVAEIRDDFGEGAPQAIWFEPLVGALSPALTSTDRATTAAQAELFGQRHRDDGHEFIAYLADVQVASLQASGDPREALAAAVRALDFRHRHLASLPGSSERIGLREQAQNLVAITLRSAAAIGEPRLMAELLEFLRAQEMPVVDQEPEADDLPFGMLLPPAAFGDRAHAPISTPESEAVILGLARRVRMPWGTIALAAMLPPSDEPCAELVIPLRDQR